MDISQIIQSIGGLPWWAILVLLIFFGVAFVVILGAGLWNGFNLKIVCNGPEIIAISYIIGVI